VSGEITSREDAVRMMDKISQYFEKNEPSSPVPMLMNRAKRLVSMKFIEILKDMAPNGVSQAASIGGISEE
jgi:type VI secretion system protein ImpA